MEIATNHERNRAKERKYGPGERDNQIRVTARHDIVGVAALIPEDNAREHGDEDGDEKSKGVFLAIVQSNAQTRQHHNSLKEEQRAQDLINDFKVDHTYCLLFLKTCLQMR